MDDAHPDLLRRRLALAEERIAELQTLNEDLEKQNTDLVFRETELRALLEKNGKVTRRDWQEIAALGTLNKTFARKEPAQSRPMKSVTPLAQREPHSLP